MLSGHVRHRRQHGSNDENDRQFTQALQLLVKPRTARAM